jgi:hypothetical protein
MAFSAFVVERKGDSMDQGVSTLTFDELPAGQVRIRVDRSAVNYKHWRTCIFDWCVLVRSTWMFVVLGARRRSGGNRGCGR